MVFLALGNQLSKYCSWTLYFWQFLGKFEERRQYAIEKAWDGVKKELLHLTPDIFSCSIAKKQPSKSSSLKGERAFAAAVKLLLYLGPELFTPSLTLRLTEKPRAKTQDKGKVLWEQGWLKTRRLQLQRRLHIWARGAGYVGAKWEIKAAWFKL